MIDSMKAVWRFNGALALALALAAVAKAQQAGGLTAEELAAEPTDLVSDVLEDRGEAIDAVDAGKLIVKPLVEIGYIDESGRYVIDLYEQDYANLAVQVESEKGRPVEGASLTLSIDGTSELLGLSETDTVLETNQYGVFEFAVAGGQMGLDTVTVDAGDTSIEILLNVISFEAFDFPKPPVVEGGLPWEDLMQAQVRFDDMTLFAEFPDTVKARSGETVKVAGFMLPLETEFEQRWFLLTSNPPHCFFHIPGGPAGAIEVFAKEGIEVSWGAVVLEGRFEALAKSDSAVYQLHDARLSQP